ncbi:MAG: hypothetical protein V4655_12615 [Bdellovibrionota bacterium]
MKSFMIAAGILMTSQVLAQNVNPFKLRGTGATAPLFGNSGNGLGGFNFPIGYSTPALEGLADKPVKIGLDSSLPHVTPGGELGHWGVGNGGDGLRIGFARARDYAANVVLRIKPNSLSNIKEPAIRDWILQNQAFLAADILQSEHLWTLEDRPTCAWTVPPGDGVKLPVSNPIQFSYVACRENTESFVNAAQILIHESVHHFNGDETTADKVAVGIIDAWRMGNMDAVSIGLENAPEASERHTAVWTGKEMIIIGGLIVGDTTSTSLATIRAYDPRTNLWRILTAPQEFGARHDVAAVWTGKEVLIWGGFRTKGTSTDWVYSGFLLNPETGAFRSVKTPDFWSPRSSTSKDDPRQTVIWTGENAIIWGGTDSKTTDPLGAILEVTDKAIAWKKMNVSSEAAPERLASHTAVWTGSKMVIWGGYLGTDDFSREITNTGGVYDPKNDSWVATNLEGAPSKRAVHQAIWTGSKMVIISGGGISTGFDLRSSGGTYDVDKDVWTKFSSELVIERIGHRAVWNGEEILLLGGKSTRFANFFGEVFAFNPVTQRWRVLGSSIAPIARNNSSIIWTGSSAIVWSGQFAGYKYDKSGAIYYP